MDRLQFENYLLGELRSNGSCLTEKAIGKRLAKADEAEAVLGHSLDISVGSDEQMSDDLIALRRNNVSELAHGQMQNVLRKYYKMKCGREFPRLRDV